jgi:hypothetical protein
MIHHRECLPLSFEAGDHLPRVHAELNHLERDSTPDRFFLFGHVNRAAAAFADLLKQFVAPDLITAPFSPPYRESGLVFVAVELSRPDGARARAQPIECLVQKSASLFVRPEQRCDAVMQFSIRPARFAQVVSALVCRQLQRGIEQHHFPWWLTHRTPSSVLQCAIRDKKGK